MKGRAAVVVEYTQLAASGAGAMLNVTVNVNRPGLNGVFDFDMVNET
jgi:hypothetical protein